MTVKEMKELFDLTAKKVAEIDAETAKIEKRNGRTSQRGR